MLWTRSAIVLLAAACSPSRVKQSLQYISGWLFERNREQWGNRDKVYCAKITQTTNPIVNMTKTIGLWLMLF